MGRRLDDVVAALPEGRRDGVEARFEEMKAEVAPIGLPSPFLDRPREINGDEGLGFYYRYEDHRVSSGTDYWGESVGSHVELCLRRYAVTKKTPKGAWIRTYGYSSRSTKFVLSAANKRFACATEREALESFVARKDSQIRILQKQMHGAMDAKGLAKALIARLPREGDPE